MKLYANNKELHGMRPFYFIEAQLRQLLVASHKLSKSDDQNIRYLMHLAASIEVDVERTLKRCRIPATSLAFAYDGVPAR